MNVTNSNPFWIKMSQIRADINNNQRNRINFLTMAFAKSTENRFLTEQPEFGAKFATLLLKKLRNDKISLPKENISSLIRQFQRSHIFQKGQLSETVIITCTDGTVSINKHLICYESDFFKQMTSSNMKEKKNENGEHHVNFSEHCRVNSVKMLKEWLYTDRMQKLDSGYEPVIDLMEYYEVLNLSKMAHMTAAYDYFKDRTKEFLEFDLSKNLKEENKMEFWHLICKLIELDKDFNSFFLKFAKLYFDSKLKHAFYKDKVIILRNLVEALKISKSIENAYKPIKKYTKKFLAKINLKEKNEEISQLVCDLTKIDKDFIPYFFKMAGPYFDAKIDVKRIPQSDAYTISIDQFGDILEVEKESENIEKESIMESSMLIRPAIAEILQQSIKGIHISDEKQLDFVIMLPYASPEILEKITHVSLCGNFQNPVTREIMLEALRLACPNFETLIIFLDDNERNVVQFLTSFKNTSSREILIDSKFLSRNHLPFDQEFYKILKEGPTVNFGPEFTLFINQNDPFITKECKSFEKFKERLTETNGLANYRIIPEENTTTNTIKTVLKFKLNE